MPDPSSLTRISLRPPSSRVMSIVVAPASIAFSTSSFTTEDGRSTTSPAAIWSATADGRIEITGMVILKLPILTPRWSGHILLLSLALDVRLLILGGIEHSFRLLRRHAGHGFWGRRLILTLRRHRAGRFVLSAATTSATTATSPSTATFLRAKRELVLPARAGISNREFEIPAVAL